LSDLRELQGRYPNTELLVSLEEHLKWIQPCCYHLNGSIRGKLAIFEEDHQQLLEYYRVMKAAVKDRISGFVLPGGSDPVGQLNQCSSLAKKAIRLMVQLHNDEGIEVPEILPKFANLLCNYFFVATLVINKVTGFEETPFVSKSYV
jgi:cob(I)alamin adenosyltransferase